MVISTHTMELNCTLPAALLFNHNAETTTIVSQIGPEFRVCVDSKNANKLHATFWGWQEAQSDGDVWAGRKKSSTVDDGEAMRIFAEYLPK
jgi:hypothetical protein